MKGSLLLVLLILPMAQAQPDRTILQAGAPPPPANISAAVNGNFGPGQTLYYWVVARYPIGVSPPQGPAVVLNAPNTLSVTRNVLVNWSSAPGATGYDLVRTSTPAIQSCSSCLFASNTAATTFTDDGSISPSSYTLASPASPATALLQLNNRDQAVPQINVSINGGPFVPLLYGSAGALPAGTGSELQYRASASAFGALPGSSVSGADLALGGNLAVGTSLLDNNTALTAPTSPALAKTGSGTGTTWGYQIVARNLIGGSDLSVEATISGNATLDGSHFIGITVPACQSGSIFFDIYRSTAAGTPGSVGQISPLAGVACSGTLNDTGLAVQYVNFSGFPGVVENSIGVGISTPLVVTSNGSAFGCVAQANNDVVFNQFDSGTGLSVLTRTSCPTFDYNAFWVDVIVDSNRNAQATSVDIELIPGLVSTRDGYTSLRAGTNVGDHVTFPGVLAAFNPELFIDPTSTVGAWSGFSFGDLGDGAIRFHGASFYGARIGNSGNLTVNASTEAVGYDVADISGNVTSPLLIGFRSNLSAATDIWSFKASGTAAIGLPTTTFAAMVAYADSAEVYCSDCQVTTVAANVVSNATCKASGAGAVASRIGGAWKCTYTP